MNTFSQGTDTWKQATKNVTISAYNPVTTEATVAEGYQITAKGAKIDIPTKKSFVVDLTKATVRRKPSR